MKRAGVLLLGLFLGLAPLARADEPPPESRAFVEIAAERDTYYVGQLIRLTLRVRYDREWFAARAVPLFRQQMDVPVQVLAAGLEEAPRPLVALEANVDTAAVQALSFVLGDEVVRARQADDEERDGRAVAVLEVERLFRAEAPGEVTLSKPTLRFRYATRFEEDFVGGRVALDPKDVHVEGQPLSFTVTPLPTEGRPEIFVDAVGHFRVGAELKVEDDKVHVTLTIEGEGNLATLSPPTGRAFPGFHVYGRLDDRQSPRRTITYDVAPLSDAVYEVPPIPLAFFDPGPPAGYEVAHTAPLPLPGREAPPIGESTDEREGVSGAAAIVILIATALGAILLAFALAAGFRRLRRQPPSRPKPEPVIDERRRRIEAATATLERALASTNPDLAAAFTSYLAAHLDCPDSAIVDLELPRRLVAAGVKESLAAETAATLERLIAARYGGGDSGQEMAHLADLLPSLEAALRQKLTTGV